LKKFIPYFLLLALIGSCQSSTDLAEKTYLGNFKEKEYDFFESFDHQTDTNFYANEAFETKYYGFHEYEPMSWIRKPDNMMLAFNTAKFIGLDNMVSFEQYNLANDFGANHEWDKLSLKDVVLGFLNSDTSSITPSYYSEFWYRRRVEHNLTEVHFILREVDAFYSDSSYAVEPEDTKSELQNLLSLDLRLMNSKDDYTKVAREYFNYLVSIGLQYSAYKLIQHNDRINLTDVERELLLYALEYDMVSYETWENMDDNRGSWINATDYHDPDRYYGP
jgi:hypothetical protein